MERSQDERGETEDAVTAGPVRVARPARGPNRHGGPAAASGCRIALPVPDTGPDRTLTERPTHHQWIARAVHCPRRP